MDNIQALVDADAYAGPVVPPDQGCDDYCQDCEGEAGGPINTCTGRYDYRQELLSIPAARPALDLYATYATIDLTSNVALGHGWTHSYAMRVYTDVFTVTYAYTDVTQAYDVLVLADADGTLKRFVYTTTADVLTPFPGIHAFATHDAEANHYVIARADRSRYTFDQGTGRLEEIADANGFTTTLAYTSTAATRVTTVTNALSGQTLVFSYTGGLLAAITDAAGRQVAFGHSANADLVGITWTVAAGSPLPATPPLTTTFSYYTTSHRLEEVVNALGHSVEKNAYDAAGRVWKQWNYGSPLTLTYALESGTGGAVTVTDALEHIVAVDHYDGRGLRTRRAGPDGITITAYAYSRHEVSRIIV